MASDAVTSHPLEMTSSPEVDDVTVSPPEGVVERLGDVLGAAYIRNQDDIRAELEAVRAEGERRVQGGERQVQGGEGQESCAMAPNCDVPHSPAVSTENFQGSSCPDQISDPSGPNLDSETLGVVMKESKESESTLWASTHSQVSINCDRLSVQFVPGDLSPEEMMTSDSRAAADYQSPGVFSANQTGTGSEWSADATRRRHPSVDDDTVVIETRDVVKTHLENFSKWRRLYLRPVHTGCVVR